MIAGLVLNINRSEIIGTCQYKTLSKIRNIKTTKNANCLGIYVGHDKTVCDQKNWYDKIEKLQSTLATWSKRNLTIFGSVAIIKALGISKVVFSVQNTSIPSDVPELIEKILYKFIWKNRERVKRKTLIRRIEDGGINMIDVKSFFNALQATWIKRILEYPNNLIGNTIIDNFGPEKLLLKINNVDIDYIKNVTSLFYKQIVTSYISTKSLDESSCVTCDDFLNQPLWGNDMFIVHRKKMIHPMYLSNWIKSDIKHIKDLIFEGSNLDIHFLLTKIKHKINIFIEILELKQALLPYADLIKQIPVDKRPINDKFQLKYLAWKTKEFYQIQIRHISESLNFQMYKKCFDNLQ